MNSYNFTDRVREALQGAREEAAKLRHSYVGTEHILLGIVRSSDSMAARILMSLGVSSASLRASVEAVSKPGSSEGVSSPDLIYTSRAKKVLEEAMTEARELNHSYVGTEHLLLGLFRERKGVAGQALATAGLTATDVRAKALEILATDPSTHRAWLESSHRETLVSPQQHSSAGLAVRIALLALAIAVIALAIALR